MRGRGAKTAGAESEVGTAAMAARRRAGEGLRQGSVATVRMGWAAAWLGAGPAQSAKRRKFF